MFTLAQKRLMYRRGQYVIPRTVFDVTTANWSEADWFKVIDDGNLWRPKSFAPEVVADNSGKFCGNALRFETEEEAKANVQNLADRWMSVTDTRVIETTDPVNYRWVDGKLVDLT